MSRRSLAIATLALMLGACTATVTPAPTAAPTPTPTPSPTPSPVVTPSGAPSGANPFAGLPYTVTLPPGWTVYDPSSPASKAALDAAAAANPNLAAAVKAFTLLPNLRMAINQLLGNVLVIIPIPSNGIPAATIAQSLTAQLQALAGTGTKVDPPTTLTLPAGDAQHWNVSISGSNPSGGTVQVDESIYLLANATTALLVEFAIPHGAAIPDEQAIVQSIRFVP